MGNITYIRSSMVRGGMDPFPPEVCFTNFPSLHRQICVRSVRRGQPKVHAKPQQSTRGHWRPGPDLHIAVVHVLAKVPLASTCGACSQVYLNIYSAPSTCPGIYRLKMSFDTRPAMLSGVVHGGDLGHFNHDGQRGDVGHTFHVSRHAHSWKLDSCAAGQYFQGSSGRA